MKVHNGILNRTDITKFVHLNSAIGANLKVLYGIPSILMT